MEEVIVVFVADGQAAEVEEPGDRAFDFVAAVVASQAATVLQGWLLTAAAVWADQLDPSRIHSLADPIGVQSAIVEHPFRFAFRHADVDERLDGVYLRVVRGGGERRERRAVAVDEQHDLGALAFLGVADLGAPFFPGENVPSPIASSQSICRRWSNLPSNPTPGGHPDSGLRPLLQSSPARCRTGVSLWQIFPTSTRLEHP